MGDVVNLRRFRKVKAREGANAQAQANRAFYGQTLTNKKKNQREKDQAERFLDQHLLIVPAEPSSSDET